ncbi:hypothetical protein OIV83_001882 [Microbotryomycetes sp. JL201]|nr:hypothetical protein OIV83_001882 [Microbotryomycetes sp. JL201]
MPPIRNKQPRPSGKFRSSGGQTIKRATKQTPAKPASGPPSSQIKAQFKGRARDNLDQDATNGPRKDDQGSEPTSEDEDKEVQALKHKTGKKQKVFVDDKDQMLSLIAGIAAEKEQQAKAKKQPKKKQATKRDEGSSKVGGKEKVLDKAKAIVAAREKAKREQHKQADAESFRKASESKHASAAAANEKPERKRVSFA